MKHKLLLFLLIITFSLVAQNKSQSIGFKENKGQIIDQKGKPNTDVKYLLNSNGLNVQLKKNGFSYDVYEVKKIPITRPRKEKDLPSHAENLQKETLPDYTLEYTFHRIDIDFVNSNSKVELITEQKSKDFDNYYNVPNKPDGIIGVYQYKQITYKNIYPNIDVVFSIPADPQKTVEYNFVIHPKGKISDIQLKFNGAETDLFDNKIQMNVRFGKMEETLPASWIEEGNSKKTITVDYIKIKKDVYGFTSSSGVSGKTVIIDPLPVRLWGTFYGGEDWTESNTIDKDDLGNIYFAGRTASVSTIATAGSHQSSAGFVKYPGLITWDGYIAKFDANGNRIWATYYGGSSDDDIKSIKVSNNKDLVFCGNSNSSNNIATTGSFKENKSGSYSEMFLGKLNSNGIRQWATYYGNDNGLTFANTVLCDKQNYIYLSGTTTSDDFISTPNSFKETIIDDNRFDGFLAKFDTNGNRIWGTYFGGDKNDFFEDSDIDKDGNIILVGYTQSENNIATANSYQPTYHLGSPSSAGDGMIVKFNSNGQRIWSTYFGDKNSDWIYTCKIYGENLYITGETENNNISTPNAFDPIMKVSYRSSYFAKFNLNTQKLAWLSYSQGNTTSIYPKNDSEIFITGKSTYGFDIACPNAYNPINNTFSGFIIKLDENCKKTWGTYFGKTTLITEPIIISEGANNIFVTGNTFSGFPDDNIASPGAFIEDPNDTTSAFLMKFQDSEPSSNPAASSNSPICIGKTLELKASGGTNYLWTGPNGFTSTDQNPTITNAASINSGEYSCLITGTGGCDDTKKITVVIGDIEAPRPDVINLPTITGDCNTVINTIPTATDVCAGSIIATTINTLSYSLPGTYTIVWNYNDGNGNHSSQEQTVIITNQPLPVAETPQTFCIQQNATLANIAINGQNIKWYDAATAGALLPNTTVLQNNTIYYATQTINGCESERIGVTINIQNTFSPTGNANQPFCSGQNPTIANIEVTGSSLKWYDASSNGSLLAETTNLQDGKTYYVSQTINNCESPRLGITVSIVNTPSVPTANSTQSFCKSENATLNEIQISGQNIKWYETDFSAAVLPNTTLLENNKTYYASQTIGCEGDRTPILVHVYDTAVPNGNSNQQFCMDENATIADIAITGTSLKWYDAEVNGNSLSEITVLQNGTYYVTQTLDNCESKRLAISVKIQDTQNPLAQTPQAFCVQENASISDIKISGENIKWFESNSSNITLSESTPLQNRVTYYASQTINNCESDRIPVTIYILEATTADCINFVDELPFPKFFTPNNDGYNDTWTIDFAYLAPNTGIRIFDRYGKFIKELYNNAAWDGNYLGKQELASDYWFKVTRLNGTEYRGHFSLKR